MSPPPSISHKKRRYQNVRNRTATITLHANPVELTAIEYERTYKPHEQGREQAERINSNHSEHKRIRVFSFLGFEWLYTTIEPRYSDILSRGYINYLLPLTPPQNRK